MTTRWLAIDVGGANIKLADSDSFARSWPFPLWRQKDQLADKLESILTGSPAFDRMAVTMTGELADCFQTKAEGVRHILAAIRQTIGSRTMAVFTTEGTWCDEETAANTPAIVAAANWLAVARFAARYVGRDGNGWLLDIGSTTTDIIPILAGVPRPAGRDDVQRLQSGELVYTGVERTPVCAVVDAVPYRGAQCPIAAEWFATMQDVYLVTGDLPEDADNRDTADGRPATREFSHRRLARLICADISQFDFDDARQVARAIAARQRQQLLDAQQRVVDSIPAPRVAVVSGHATFLASPLAQPLASDMVVLAERIGESASRCAPAYALACLAGEDL